MSAAIEALVQIVWTQLWQVSLAIVCVWLLTRWLCHKRPHLSYLLWMLVLVKCLTPPIWSFPTGVFSWVQLRTEVVPAAGAAGDERLLDGSGSAGFAAGPTAEAVQRIKTSLASEAQFAGAADAENWEGHLTATALPHPKFTWLFALVWALGMVLGAVLVVVKHFFCLRILNKTSCKVDDRILELVTRLQLRLGVRARVRVLITERPWGPAVYGILRPTVVLPQKLARQSSETIEPIIAHEMIHFRRGDTISGLLQLLAQVVWWFHPLVWWANRIASRERERCCDEEAVVRLGCAPEEYAQSLIDVLRMKRALRPLLSLPGMKAVEITARRLEYIVRESHRFQRRTPSWCWVVVLFCGAILLPGGGLVLDLSNAAPREPDPLTESNQFGRSPARNAYVTSGQIPISWDLETGEAVRWRARIGSVTFATPTVAGGKVFVGSNNIAAYLKRFPNTVDLGSLLCFDERTGAFLWQHSSPKLATGRENDWPMIGVCSTACVEGDRLWFVTNRCEVVCLDTDGFHDGENDGQFRGEESTDTAGADVIWSYDMMGQLGVRPHNKANCSVTVAGELVLVVTSHGVDESHSPVEQSEVPSFIALHRETGKLVWSDRAPTAQILHGQWSSPAYAVIDGVAQAIFAGGDGWVYSYDFRKIDAGQTEMLWWFDCNPKDAEWKHGGRGTRNNLLATPVVVNNRVYIATGRDPEHGDGAGILWCIDATRRGDISAEQVFNVRDRNSAIPHKRIQACDLTAGDFTRPNPNSGVVWRFEREDSNGDAEFSFDEKMHRTTGNVAVAGDLAFSCDTAGIFRCLDANSGRVLWVHDLLASVWGSPLVVGDKVVIGDEDGDITVFRAAPTKHILLEKCVNGSVFSSIVFANNSLYVATSTQLLALGELPQQLPRGTTSRLPTGLGELAHLPADKGAVSDRLRGRIGRLKPGVPECCDEVKAGE